MPNSLREALHSIDNSFELFHKSMLDAAKWLETAMLEAKIYKLGGMREGVPKCHQNSGKNILLVRIEIENGKLAAVDTDGGRHGFETLDPDCLHLVISRARGTREFQKLVEQKPAKPPSLVSPRMVLQATR